MKIAIAAAMKEEIAPFRKNEQIKLIVQRGKVIIEEVITTNGASIYLVETGIGKANAAAAASLICEWIHPELIINTGTAGGLSENVKIGDVVYGTSLMYSDVNATGFNYTFGQVPQMPTRYLLPEKWLSAKAPLEQPNDYSIHEGLIVTADSFMSDPVSVATVKKRFPQAFATDMESTAIAQIAHFYEVPVLNIRGISDLAGQESAIAFDNHLEKAAAHAFIQTKKTLKYLIDKY